MRPEVAYLRDILISAAKIESLVSDKSLQQLVQDDTVQAAILYHLVIVGEAVKSLPNPLRARYPEVPWNAIVALRNRVVHGYFGLDWQLIWPVLTDRIPELQKLAIRILREEFGEAG